MVKTQNTTIIKSGYIFSRKIVFSSPIIRDAEQHHVTCHLVVTMMIEKYWMSRSVKVKQFEKTTEKILCLRKVTNLCIICPYKLIKLCIRGPERRAISRQPHKLYNIRVGLWDCLFCFLIGKCHAFGIKFHAIDIEYYFRKIFQDTQIFWDFWSTI